MPSRPPLRSINENVDYRAEQYHVQTEDDVGSFTTHLYRGGVIIATEVGEYSDKNLNAARELMVAQHEGLKNRLFGREFDEKIASLEAEKRAAKRRTRRMSSKRYRGKKEEESQAQPLPEPPPSKKRRRRDRTTEEVSALSAEISLESRSEPERRPAAAGSSDVPPSEVLTPRPNRRVKKGRITSRDLPLVQEEQPLQRARSRVDLPSVLAADSKLTNDATIVDIPMNEVDAPSVDSVEVFSAEATLIDLDSEPDRDLPIEAVPKRPVRKPRRLPVDSRDTRADFPTVSEAKRPARKRVRLPSSEARVPPQAPADLNIQQEIIARKAVAAQTETQSRSRARMPSSEARLVSEPPKKAPPAEPPSRPARVRLPSEATKIVADAAKSQPKPRPRRAPTSEVRRRDAAAKAPRESRRPTPQRIPVPPTPPVDERSVQEMFLDYLIRGDDD